MKKILENLRDTFFAGLIFLMPIMILLFLLGKVFVLVKEKSVKLAVFLGVKSFLGISGAGLLGIAAIILGCLLFGLLMRFAFIKRFNIYFDRKLSSFVPLYGVYSKMALDRLDVSKKFQLYEAMVWVRFEDSWQPGFLAKRFSAEQFLVFIPDAGPGNNHTGSLHLVKASNVMICPDVPMKEVSDTIAQIGSNWPEVPLPPA